MEAGRPDGSWTEVSADAVRCLDPDLASPIVGLEAYRADLKPLVGEVAYAASEYVRPRVARYGDLAVLTCQSFSTVLDKDGSVKTRVPWHCTEVYTKVGGAWRIVHPHWLHIKGVREGGGVRFHPTGIARQGAVLLTLETDVDHCLTLTLALATRGKRLVACTRRGARLSASRREVLPWVETSVFVLLKVLSASAASAR